MSCSGTARLRARGGFALCAGLLCAGCSFDVHGFDLPSISALDLSGGDGGPRLDLPPGAFVPSNVSPSHVQDGASSLSGIHDLDTELLLIDGQPPVVGVIFVPELTHDEWAVLSVRDFVVSADVRVHGRRGLVVVATGDVKLSAVIHAEANVRAPGPGGQFTGPGHGGDGKSNVNQDSGGGGGGHGAVGGVGGASTAATNNQGGLPGPSYGGGLLGGSGGGAGAGADTMIPAPCPAGSSYSLGGAGGGIVQISAKGMIELSASGGVNAGGGGGRAGCAQSASAGAGGGSGGTIWLEAPGMRLLGKLAANGGGGGSGGRNVLVSSMDGQDGADGPLSLQPAPGGSSVGSDSGSGGAGGVAGSDGVAGGVERNAGGGGGATGIVRLRTRGAAPVTDPGTLMSPAPQLTVDF